MSDAISACFSLDGKYLFFAASTNYGLNTGWLDMSSYGRGVERNLYVVVLNKEESSPFFPESDEEATEEQKKEEQKNKSRKKSQRKRNNRAATPKQGMVRRSPSRLIWMISINAFWRCRCRRAAIARSRPETTISFIWKRLLQQQRLYADELMT
ncbi:MAG: hypothetical protein R2867_44905 [Caldilineaceae bacterium]